jgi:hypothetical protein
VPAPGVAPLPAGTPVPAADVVAALARRYRVFAAPRTAADVIPKRLRRDVFHGLVEYFDDARLVASRAGYRVWVIPASLGGRPELCTLAFITKPGGGGGCGEITSSHVGSNTYVGHGLRVFFALLPDDAVTARLTEIGGRVFTEPVQRNGVILGPAHKSASLDWIDREGHTHAHALDPGLQ